MDIQAVIRREQQKIAERTQLTAEKKLHCRRLLEPLVACLSKKYEVSTVILIGSLARNADGFNLDSDIDLVVIGLEPTKYLQAWIDVNNIANPVAEVDLIDWSSANEQMRIITEQWGETIYERSHAAKQ